MFFKCSLSEKVPLKLEERDRHEWKRFKMTCAAVEWYDNDNDDDNAHHTAQANLIYMEYEALIYHYWHWRE